MPVGTATAIDMLERINNINNISFKSQPLTQQIDEDESDVFDKILQSAMNAIQEVSDYQAASDKLQMDFALGNTDDMLSVMLAQEKAYFSLNFTVQVANKVVEAYKEIMRMQI